jgi:hypothetical protein
MKSRSDALKASNIKWLVMLAVLDAAVVLLFITPELVDAGKLALLRASVTPLVPVAVLLLTGLFSHEAKARLVDMAAMSLLLIPLVPAALWYAGAPPASRWIAGGLFALQYVVCAIGARHSGTRFVCNVLAVHSTTKVKAKAKAAP